MPSNPVDDPPVQDVATPVIDPQRNFAPPSPPSLGNPRASLQPVSSATLHQEYEVGPLSRLAEIRASDGHCVGQ